MTTRNWPSRPVIGSMCLRCHLYTLRYMFTLGLDFPHDSSTCCCKCHERVERKEVT